MSRSRLALVVFAGVILVATALFFTGRAWSERAARPVSSVTTTPSVRGTATPTPAPTLTPTPAPTPTSPSGTPTPSAPVSGPTPTPTAVSAPMIPSNLPPWELTLAPGTESAQPPELRQAALVAVAFLTAWTTTPGCESNEELAARLLPYTTDPLAKTLSFSAAPPCIRTEPSRATKVKLVSEGWAPLDRSILGFVYYVDVMVGEKKTRILGEVYMRDLPSGWKVSQLRPGIEEPA